LRRAIDEVFRATDTASEPFARHADLLREILGNPFRPARVERPRPGAVVGGVVGVARSIYEGRRFEDLPVLADALEEAGAADAELVAHCRRPGGHVRGCWALDLILGKE